MVWIIRGIWVLLVVVLYGRMMLLGMMGVMGTDAWCNMLSMMGSMVKIHVENYEW